MGANRSAKSSVDAVVSQIHVDAARWADGRTRRGIQFLRHPAIKACDRRYSIPVPDALEAPEESLRRGDAAIEIEARFCRGRLVRHREMLAALATKRVSGCGILHLFKATVRTIHTDFDRRFSHRRGSG